MASPEGPSPNQSERETADELARIPYEPLLPVEIKLITFSLLLGVLLLALLVWVSHTYFPVSIPPQ